MKTDNDQKANEKVIKFRKKETADEILAASLRRVLDAQQAEYRAEMAKETPYIFSEEFENKMKKLMEVRKRKTKLYKTLRYAAATFVTVLLVGGILFVGNEEVRASKMGINILAWMENFFLVDEGETSRKEEEVLFEESQIGYLPDGFEKVLEEITRFVIYYKYQNADGDYIILRVYADKINAMIDNEKIIQKVYLNAAGLEYRFINTEEEKASGLVWSDTNERFYKLIGTISEEELVNIMDSITY